MAIFRLIAFVLFLAVCAQAQAKDTETAFDRVMRTRTLRCGYFTWAPYVVKDANSGEISGFNHDVIESLAKGMGLKVEWTIETAPADIVPALAAGKFDAYCLSIWETPARAATMRFIGSIGYSGVYPYVRPDNKTIKSLSDINNPNVTISVMEGEGASQLAHQVFDKAKYFEVSQLGGASDIYTNVITKKADVVMSDMLTVDDLLKTNPNSLKMATTESIGTFPMSFAVGRDEIALQNAFNQALHIMISTGELDRLFAKYKIKPEAVHPPTRPY